MRVSFPSSSLPVTANATPKRSLPIHILEKDTPLLNCCQRKTSALFKPFAEPLPKQSPVSNLIPSQTPPHLHIYPLSLTGAFPLSPLSRGEAFLLSPLPQGEGQGEGKIVPTAISANNKPCAFAHEPNPTPTCITGVLRKNRLSSQYQTQHRRHHPGQHRHHPHRQHRKTPHTIQHARTPKPNQRKQAPLNSGLEKCPAPIPADHQTPFSPKSIERCLRTLINIRHPRIRHLTHLFCASSHLS